MDEYRILGHVLIVVVGLLIVVVGLLIGVVWAFVEHSRKMSKLIDDHVEKVRKL